VLGVKDGEGDQKPAQDHIGGGGLQLQIERVVLNGKAGLLSYLLRDESPDDEGPDAAHGQLHNGVAQADGRLAGAAAANQKEPAEHRDVFPPTERSQAGRAVGARRGYVAALRPSAQANVQKAAEGQAEEAGEDGAEDEKCLQDYKEL